VIKKDFSTMEFSSHNINAILSSGFMNGMNQASLRNEFGPGLYTTPNIDYSILYAGRNGTLIII